MRGLRKKLAVPGALVLSACGTANPSMDAGFDGGRDAGTRDAGTPDAGTYDAGPCPMSAPGDPMSITKTLDAGLRCQCSPLSLPFGDGGQWLECCDDPVDVGNPCPVCCSNPRNADGGRSFVDAGEPVCSCFI